jgi:hypothetical protein
MDYVDFIHSFKNTQKIYNENNMEIDDYYIMTVNNLMIERQVLKVLRLLEGIDNKLRRDYIMNKVLKLAPK